MLRMVGAGVTALFFTASHSLMRRPLPLGQPSDQMPRTGQVRPMRGLKLPRPRCS